MSCSPASTSLSSHPGDSDDLDELPLMVPWRSQKMDDIDSKLAAIEGSLSEARAAHGAPMSRTLTDPGARVASVRSTAPASPHGRSALQARARPAALPGRPASQAHRKLPAPLGASAPARARGGAASPPSRRGAARRARGGLAEPGAGTHKVVKMRTGPAGPSPGAAPRPGRAEARDADAGPVGKTRTSPPALRD
ncbi:unnamed protein product [Prorocentrum cordatum]|uniref:Uncharacterized protein n=1 Tax=Prorocentrum cordatum TaxID=2364126 RepID=A0ABN9QGI6_9DINO|nr:unnamed protein product [Polarella glacialis]